METNIIPFGKYKGKQIEEVLSCDPQYFEWAKTQEWFKEKYSITYNQVVNIFNPQKSDCSPEHNRIQAMFLDESEECLSNKIAEYVFKKIYSINHYIFKYTIHKDPFTDQLIYKKNENFIDVLENIPIDRIEIDNLNFEDCGFDVVFESKYILNDFDYLSYAIEKDIERDLLYGEYILNFHDDYEDHISNTKYRNWFIIKFTVEIKPTIGDDYPAILRQIKKQQNLFRQKYKTIDYETILLTEEINVKYLSEQQVIDFFKNENILVYKI